MAWPEASGTRIVFHIGDAPPHGKSGCGGHPFHSMHDDHPAGHPSDLPLDTLFQQMQDKELDYYFGAINTSTDGMLKTFERYCGRPIQSFNVTKPASIGSAVSASVMDSVSVRSSVASEGPAGPSRLPPMDKTTPRWTMMPVVDATIMTLDLPDSIEHITSMAPLEQKVVRGSVQAESGIRRHCGGLSPVESPGSPWATSSPRNPRGLN